MTTIAYDCDDGNVAADSQETGDGGQKYNCIKIYRVRGYVIATAGGTYAGMAFVRWFGDWIGNGEPDWDDHPDFVNLDYEEDFECLVIRKNGTCYSVNRLFVPHEQIGNRYIAIGSGGAAARGAMLAGATPREAVEIAKQIDTFTGGDVQEMSIGPARYLDV